MINILFSSSALAAFLLPALAHAEIGAEAAGKTDILVLGNHDDEVNAPTQTGSRLGLTILETPASVETLPGDMIRRRGDLSIVDAVTRATGISSVANPGNGGTGLAARGFSGQGSVMILYDGVRLYPGAGTVTFPTDPWTVDRIEVLRGPASVLYGQGAIGGAVNVISKKPNTERTELEAEASYGSQNSWRIGAGVGGPVNDLLAYRLDVSRTQSDGWVDRGKSEGLAISGSLQFRPIETLTFTLSDDYSDQQPMRYFGTPLIDGRLDDRNKRSNYNVANAAIRYKDNRTTVKIEWIPNDTITVRNTSYRLTTDRRWRNLESYFWNGVSGKVDRFDFFGIDHDQTQVGNQGDVTIRSNWGVLKNELLVGFDVNNIKFRHSNDFDSGSPPSGFAEPVDPFSFDPGLYYNTFGVRPQYRTRTRQYSLFAEDRLTISDHLSVSAGINFDRANVKRYVISHGAGGATSEALGLDKTLRNVTWRVGAVYKPVSTLSIYGQYATAVDPLGSLVTFSVGQAAFKHTTGDQVEAGVKASFMGGRGLATFAAYRIVKKNLLATIPGSLPPVQDQVGQRSAKGIEASITLDLPGGFGIDANGTILDAQFDEFLSGSISFSGNTPPNIPEETANLWLRYDVTERVQTRVGLRYVGKTYSDNANQFRVPAYAVVDGGISFAVTKNVAANLRIYNLFDKDYATTTYNNEQWLLGRPRSIDASVSMRF
ncbi:TonB-dependent receptor [Rhizorhapis suberifaciens]|uniref:Iron complex outermembrane receptor protein n=1 Tax=Rhizorhapis suberifaciens TaxID=13656 RepID=A0A840HRZ7_9SPHN|nr:TonB-dependent receptor [Rhizorhapis suberifaciens]MBB4640397.1 iron complex outermembrane receptor protein [Rhizorhapis suberifaciens]